MPLPAAYQFSLMLCMAMLATKQLSFHCSCWDLKLIQYARSACHHSVFVASWGQAADPVFLLH